MIDFLAQLATAYAAKDYRRVDALSLPEGNKTLEESIADPWKNRIFARSFVEGLPKRVPVKLRAMLYLGKRLLVLYDLPGGEISQAILSKRDGSYFLAEHLPEEYGIDAEYFCYYLGKFLEQPTRTPTDLIVR